MTPTPDEDQQEPINTRRAPHMERYVRVRPWATEAHPDGHKVELVIENQGFPISNGADYYHETRQEAEWCRDMLCIALDRFASASGEWKTIDSAPRDGTVIILGWEGQAVDHGFWDSDAREWMPDASMAVEIDVRLRDFPEWMRPPTHWRRVPAPPSAASGECSNEDCSGGWIECGDDAYKCDHPSHEAGKTG